MNNLIKTVVHIPKNYHFYQIPDFFSKPIEIKEEAFSSTSANAEYLYVVVSDEREKGRIENAIFWDVMEPPLVLLGEYVKSLSKLELELWKKVKVSLEVLYSELKVLSEDFTKLDRETLSNLYLFYNELLMYGGEIDPFEYFLQASKLKKTNKKSVTLFLLNDVSKFTTYKKIEIDSRELPIFSLKYSLYLKELNSLKKKKTLRESLRLVEEFFNEIEVPIAVYNKFDDLIIHNKQFGNLGLLTNEVIGLESGESFEHKGYVYEAQRTTFEVEDSNFKLFHFNQGEEESGKALQIEEMGVITSSIAHELNNPIGGILTGSEVLLSLDLGLSDSEKDILHEVKKSALRCRSLIEIFLGFARPDMNTNMRSECEESIEQALSLLRTRFVESGHKIDLHIKREVALEINNLPLWTMINYTFLTCVVNGVMKKNLISGKKGKDIQANVNILESKFYYQIRDTEIEEVLIELNESSFFHQLLSFAQLEFYFENDLFIFEKR